MWWGEGGGLVESPISLNHPHPQPNQIRVCLGGGGIGHDPPLPPPRASPRKPVHITTGGYRFGWGSMVVEVLNPPAQPGRAGGRVSPPEAIPRHKRRWWVGGCGRRPCTAPGAARGSEPQHLFFLKSIWTRGSSRQIVKMPQADKMAPSHYIKIQWSVWIRGNK